MKKNLQEIGEKKFRRGSFVKSVYPVLIILRNKHIYYLICDLKKYLTKQEKWEQN